MSYISPVFDVTKFGAVGDGSAGDTSGIQAAVDAAVTAGGGCVYFPKGTYKITSSVTKTNPGCSLSLRGDGSKVSIIRQDTGSGTNGFKFDLMAPLTAGSFVVGHTYRILTIGTTNFTLIGASSNTVGLTFTATGAGSGSGTADEPGNAQYVVDVVGLGFIANNASTACGDALTIAYGTDSGGSEQNRGPVISDININAASGAKGWTNGLAMNTCWHADIKDVYAYGSNSTYNSGSGAGSGAGIALNGGVNILVSNVQCEWWAVGVLLQKGSASIGNQGVLIDAASIIECVKGIYVHGGGGETDGSGSHTITNCLVDSGNVTSNGYGIYLESVREIFVSNSYFIVKGSTSPVAKLIGVTESVFTACQFFGATASGVSMGDDGGGTHSKNNVVTACVFRGQTNEVVIDSSSTGNRVNNNQVAPGQTRANTDNDGRNMVGDAGGKQHVTSLTGGSATENIDVDITQFALGAKAESATIQLSGTHGGELIDGRYDYTSGSNTKTSARFVLFKMDGSNLPSGSRRFNVMIAPYNIQV